MRQIYVESKVKKDKGRVYETLKTKEIKKEHNEEANADQETKQEQELKVLLITHGNNISHSFFSEC